ncbi:MAG: Tat pathway signal protein [Rhizobiales bacterium]|nr:Tat pathway signal protein [Hyphomicrobiales bacterium]
MKSCSRRMIFALATLAAAIGPARAEGSIAIELNKIEEAAGKCRTYFVVREDAGRPVQTLKADFIVFGKDGGVSLRLAAELGPIRSHKTTVKIFEIEETCGDISGVLLNDIMTCQPAAGPEECLDRIALASRVSVKFFK